jgi:hypothetical protein
MELKPAVCEDEANFPGHANIRREDQSRIASEFCRGLIPIPDMDPQSEPYLQSIDHLGTNYLYYLSWIIGCKATVDRQRASTPLGEFGPHCSTLFTRAYEQCKLHGIDNQMSSTNILQVIMVVLADTSTLGAFGTSSLEASNTLCSTPI